MKKRIFLLGVLFLAVPLYHHLLWIYIWNKHASWGHTQKQEHFFDLALFPSSPLPILSKCLPLRQINQR